MFEITLIVTAVLLVLAFLFAELYTRAHGIIATVVSISELGVMSMGLLMKAKVRLGSGSEVDAELPGCTACMENLRVGDKVRLLKSQNGYRITARATGRNTTAEKRLIAHHCHDHQLRDTTLGAPR